MSPKVASCFHIGLEATFCIKKNNKSIIFYNISTFHILFLKNQIFEKYTLKYLKLENINYPKKENISNPLDW